MTRKTPKIDRHDWLSEPLAIIGANCQLPGTHGDIEDIDALHNMLIKRCSPIKDVPKNRWDIDVYYDPDRKKVNKIVSRQGGFLTGPHLFDSDFFNISPIEAKQIDPQQRLFLEVAIRAINHANLRLDSLKNSNTGVYCGISTHDYRQLNYQDQIKINAYTHIGVASSAAAGRLSNFLQLTGPSMAVDTSCTSSLSALYLAAMALRTRQCDLAIAGGVHLSLCPDSYIGLSKAHLLSKSGRCHSFDIKADGFVRSEGCGVVIIKRISDAIADGNPICAIIKSIVTNQNGSGGNLVAPSVTAQIHLHKAALAEANLTAADIDYIETHGTGTVIGDMTEFSAIQAIHQGQHTHNKPLIIGALKSNLGHTLSASGIASLLKVINAFRYETIPPNFHDTVPNQNIQPISIPCLFPNHATPFTRSKHKNRVAQISNFGFSGTNVSLIVEEYRDNNLNPATPDNDEEYCFAISAQSESSLYKMIVTYAYFLQTTTASLNDLCSALIQTRDHYRFRCAVLVKKKQALIDKLLSKNYRVQKVTPAKNQITIANHAQSIYQHYLAGDNIRLASTKTFAHLINLPLYTFDRKPYWHQPRKKTPSTHWLDALHQQSQEQQVAAIKTQVSTLIKHLLNKTTIDADLDFESLGLTNDLLDKFHTLLYELLSPRYKIPADNISRYFTTVDKLGRQLRNLIFPFPVHRQPVIQILNSEPIAIIGMGCRFPKAPNIDAFLALLTMGESGMSDIPADRWDNNAYYNPDIKTPGKLHIKQLGLIDEINKFDADFFNISPREAKLMAPQLRVFMETSYHALEHANLSLDQIKNSHTGVFVGVGTNEYPSVLNDQGLSLEELNIYFATGNVLNALAGRVAYAFDFHGPIQAVDTACSSSLTAIHNACLSLQSGDCKMALAGGVNILLRPDSNITLSKAKMLSPESRCKTFSDDADGYARSEGCGVIVLKRLSTAIQDNDSILAVIKGSSVNSNGKGGGFTVPNGTAQEEVIRSALTKAKLTPGNIDYIEAHGTGTPLADPIEVNTLTKIFSESHSPANPLYISAVKTNIGHCESASGVASVIKTVLSIQHKIIFKHLNFKQLNPWIKLKNTVIPLTNIIWRNDQHLRAAGVSSFGFSGANAHMVIQEAPTREQKPRSLPEKSLLVLSAKHATSLERLLLSYNDYLFNTSDAFADICYTAATCRQHFLFRVGIVANSARQAAEMIQKKQYQILSIQPENERVQHLVTLDQLKTAYLGGYALNWLDYYQSLTCTFQKVSLPLYAFIRDSYWFEDKAKRKDASVPKDWFRQLQWQTQPISSHQKPSYKKHWLLIGAEYLAPGLGAIGLNIILGDESLDNLDGIIFATGLETLPCADIEANMHRQKAIIKNFLDLIQRLQKTAVKLQLIVLTANGIAELPSDKFNILHSTLIGFCRTLVLELPQYQTLIIDTDNRISEDYLTRIIYEIQYNHGQYYEHLVAYRDGLRWIPRLQKASLIHQNSPLSSQGRYLITGGCGGLGLITAQALLSSGAKELILMSRKIDGAELTLAIQNMQTQYPDRKIRLVSLDITHKQSLENLLSDLNADGGLKGIVHAAGTAIKTELIHHKNEDVDYLFAAKVSGGWYLHELTQNYSLDFFLVYSSISAVFGSNKEAIYGATNCFLDALIAERQNLGLVGTSVQWGPWGEVGMAKNRHHDQALAAATIHNGQGQALIKQLIHNPCRHITILSPEYLAFMLDFVPQPRPNFHQCLANDLNKTESSLQPTLSSWLNHYLSIPDHQKSATCQEMISKLCKQILEYAETDVLDDDAGFFMLGFDSLMIVELMTQLKKNLAPLMKLTVNIGFDYPSIRKLAKYIHSELDKQSIRHPLSESSLPPPDDSIAIISMACSFPNAPDLTSLEYLLHEGLSGIKDIPLERWDNRQYFDANTEAPGKSYVDKLGLLDDVAYFDADFFGISPREAKLMDPQQRLFLQACYTALENANYPSESLQRSLTGVFAGVGPNEYYAQLEKSGFSDEELSVYSITGNVLNLIPGRISYTFDFRGPAISIDTACSSSLVAVHYACQSLKNKEIDYALAGGVNLLFMPESNITLCKAKALSPEGQCKTFDAEANGYVRGEGCGVIFLKRTVDALRDKDSILAVIKASAINNDGKSAGLTVPNGKSQAEVMQRALNQANLSSHDIGYVEAHGTGTRLGDPIEVHAINQVYGHQRNPTNPLYIGTIKTNIGHLESASGVAGLMKAVIALQKQILFKNLNFKQLNPEISLQKSRIALHNTAWASREKPRCAAVNAFGFSGTNAHVILQESPLTTEKNRGSPNLPNDTPRDVSSGSRSNDILVLSAKSKPALDRLIARYQIYLSTTSNHFSDICFTAATCRNHYPHRLAVVAQSASEASQKLANDQWVVSASTDANPYLLNYLTGQTVHWFEYYQKQNKIFRKVTLPNYSFEPSYYWLDKKTVMTPHALLEHLYAIQWYPCDIDTPAPQKQAFVVISQDIIKASNICRGLTYQQIPHINQLDSPKNKNIIFIFQEGELNHLLQCCQVLLRQKPTRFILLTQKAYAVHESTEVNPYHTMASSFWKSFRNEWEHPANYLIDLNTDNAIGPALEKVFHANQKDNQYAFRAQTLYRPILEKQPIPHFYEPTMLHFDSQASYLITGGTGGLAKILIDYLVQRGVQHIIILSRSDYPQERRQKTTIHHEKVDASDFKSMEKILQSIEKNSPPLKGIFHLAGMIQDSLIIHLDKQRLNNVLRSKMQSALVLHQLTKHLPLDFFVLFSSSASLLGAKGQANYAAANGFLDGLAHLRCQQGLPALSINWGPFHTPGMSSAFIQGMQQQGFMPLAANSIDILDRLLQKTYPQIAPCPIQSPVCPPKDRECATGKDFITDLKQKSPEESLKLLSDILCSIAAKILRLTDNHALSEKDNLFSIGMDSLMALELRSHLHDKLNCPGLSLPIEYFVHQPTIQKIAHSIFNELNIVDESAPIAHAEEIPLSDFQYVFWIFNKLKFGFNLGIQIQIQGDLNQDYVFQALDHLVKQNSAFWININPKIPTQSIRKQGQFQLIYTEKPVKNTFYKNIAAIIPLNAQPLIRSYLYKIDNGMHELQIIMPHMIAEDYSCEIVLQQFKHNYTLLSEGKSLSALATETDKVYLNYIKKHQLHYQKHIDEKINFWRNYNHGFSGLYFGSHAHYPDAVGQSKHLHHYPLDPHLTQKLIYWHQANNTNISSGLIAACQLVFYKLTGQKKLPVTLIHSGREGHQYKTTVGLFAEYKRINLTLPKQYSIQQCVFAIESQMLKTAPYQTCSRFIKDFGLKQTHLALGAYVLFKFNQCWLGKRFQASQLHPKIIHHYLVYLSRVTLAQKIMNLKSKLNQWFGYHFPIQPPVRLRVIISITPSFFSKPVSDPTFAGLKYIFPEHYACDNQAVGNQTLWIYFTRNQYGEPILSINGPLKKPYKDQIALEFHKVIKTVEGVDKDRVTCSNLNN